MYVGKTDRKLDIRTREYKNDVRLTKEDIDRGNLEKATKRMNVEERDIMHE